MKRVEVLLDESDSNGDDIEDADDFVPPITADRLMALFTFVMRRPMTSEEEARASDDAVWHGLETLNKEDEVPLDSLLVVFSRVTNGALGSGVVQEAVVNLGRSLTKEHIELICKGIRSIALLLYVSAFLSHVANLYPSGQGPCGAPSFIQVRFTPASQFTPVRKLES